MPTDSLTPILPQHIDATMVSCFRACPRKFYHEFILGLRPPGLSIDLHAGGAFAHALEVVRKEVFINARPLSEALVRANAAFEIYWGDFQIPEHKTTTKRPDRVWAAVEEYFRQYAPHTDHIQPYFVNGKPTFEFTFAIPLGPTTDDEAIELVKLTGETQHLWPTHPVTGDPFLYTGRFDMMGEYLGNPVICDDKTSGTGHYSGWSEKWDLRSQFIGYTWATQQLGIPCDTTVVRGVGILMKSIALAEAIKPYSDDLRAKWLEQLRRDLWRICDMWQSGYWDYNFAETCTSYGNCVYSMACQSHDPEPWLKNFDVRRWNPVAIDPIRGGASTQTTEA
jgi:PD-(D/E)XK nuclease superfamily